MQSVFSICGCLFLADIWREAYATVPPGQRSRQRTGCLSRLRATKGLSAALGCHPERSEGSARGAQRCFAEFTLSEANGLSMTARTAVKAAQVRSQEKSSLQMSRRYNAKQNHLCNRRGFTAFRESTEAGGGQSVSRYCPCAAQFRRKGGGQTKRLRGDHRQGWQGSPLSYAKIPGSSTCQETYIHTERGQAADTYSVSNREGEICPVRENYARLVQQVRPLVQESS